MSEKLIGGFWKLLVTEQSLEELESKVTAPPWCSSTEQILPEAEMVPSVRRMPSTNNDWTFEVEANDSVLPMSSVVKA